MEKTKTMVVRDLFARCRECEALLAPWRHDPGKAFCPLGCGGIVDRRGIIPPNTPSGWRLRQLANRPLMVAAGKAHKGRTVYIINGEPHVRDESSHIRAVRVTKDGVAYLEGVRKVATELTKERN